MVQLGSGSEREVDDVLMTRYGLFLTAQNSDPAKVNVALVQSYCTIKTREMELIEDGAKEIARIDQRRKLTISEKTLSSVCLEHGVKPNELAIVRSEGDKLKFGGNSTADMKKLLDIPDTRAIGDFLPKLTLSAKEFAADVTAHQVTDNNLQGVDTITDCHKENNEGIRQFAISKGITFENLPKAEDIRKVERKINAKIKSLSKENK